jgi:hypothetical protein
MEIQPHKQDSAKEGHIKGKLIICKALKQRTEGNNPRLVLSTAKPFS